MKKYILSIFLFGIMSSAFSLPPLVTRESFDVNDIEDLAINLSWENLELEEGSLADSIQVEIYCNKNEIAPQISTRGSKLIVKSKKNAGGIFNKRSCTVILKVPSSYAFSTLALGTTSGHISSKTILKADILAVDSTSGSLSFTLPAYAERASFNATSASIFVDGLYGKKLAINSTSGSINVNQFDGNSCTINATSGSVKLTGLFTKEAYINTTSGTISIAGSVTDSLKIDATSGTIGLELETVPSDNTLVTTTSGTIFAAFPANADYSVMITTNSGPFVNTITGEATGSHARYKANINAGGPFVMLTSNSGRITLDSTDGITGKTAKSITDKEEAPASSASNIPVVSFDDPIFE